MNEILLFDYYRSSACYRVRIALNLKGVEYRSVQTSLLEAEHREASYVARNPQGFVPMLSIDGHDLTQSIAIIEYLDSRFSGPRLIPADAVKKARAMANALIIAADIHPINNLRVLKYLKGELGVGQDDVDNWYRHWIAEGFAALEQRAPKTGLFGGDYPDIADICLVPQLYNARRFNLPLDPFPKLVRICSELEEIDAVARAHPDRVNPAS